MEDEKHLAKLRTDRRKTAVFPPMAKLCNVMGLSSKPSMFALQGRLTNAGYLERQVDRITPTKKLIARPIIGPVRAGLAQPVSHEEPELVTVDDYLIDDPNSTSMRRVRGDSMQDAGIVDGYLLAVEHNTPTKPATSSWRAWTTKSPSRRYGWTPRAAGTSNRPTRPSRAFGP